MGGFLNLGVPLKRIQGFYRDYVGFRVQCVIDIRDTFLRGPHIIVYSGLYWGCFLWGDHHVMGLLPSGGLHMSHAPGSMLVDGDVEASMSVREYRMRPRKV